ACPSFSFWRALGGRPAGLSATLDADARFRHRLPPVQPVSAAIARAELRVPVRVPGFVGRGRPCLPFQTTLNQNRGNVQRFRPVCRYSITSERFEKRLLDPAGTPLTSRSYKYTLPFSVPLSSHFVVS